MKSEQSDQSSEDFFDTMDHYQTSTYVQNVNKSPTNIQNKQLLSLKSEENL